MSGNRRLDEPRSFTMDVDGITEKTAEAIYPSILAGSHVPINPTRQRLLAAHVKAVAKVKAKAAKPKKTGPKVAAKTKAKPKASSTKKKPASKTPYAAAKDKFLAKLPDCNMINHGSCCTSLLVTSS